MCFPKHGIKFVLWLQSSLSFQASFLSILDVQCYHKSYTQHDATGKPGTIRRVTLPQQAVRFRDGKQWDCVQAPLLTVMHSFNVTDSELVRNRNYLLFFIPPILSHYGTLI